MRRLTYSEIITLLLTGAGLALAATAQASETINYSYDTRGRLIAVNRSGSVNNQVNTTYNTASATPTTPSIG